MSETTPARLLRLLSLLQMHRYWTGTELAERLGVTTRTIRRDVDRLRDLGYPVHAVIGPVGGYRLGAGASLPPLLLDDDEAVAVTLGLQNNAIGTVTGIEEASLCALTKVEQVLPTRLRHRVDALRSAVVAMPPGYDPGPSVDARAEDLAGRVEGIVTPVDEHTCRLEMGSDSYALVALVVGLLDAEFEVESPPELVTHLQVLAGRFTRATSRG